MEGSPLIAIVDDDAAVRDSLDALLICSGFATSCHASGEAFLSHRDRKLADCLILDIDLPGQSGLETLSQLRREGCRMPVVLLTGRPLAQTWERARLIGASKILNKPPSEAALVDALRACLSDPYASPAARPSVQQGRRPS